jgi:hypothetical protein
MIKCVLHNVLYLHQAYGIVTTFYVILCFEFGRRNNYNIIWTAIAMYYILVTFNIGV